jgi:proprotein convertase subtilisin/kexin type 7
MVRAAYASRSNSKCGNHSDLSDANVACLRRAEPGVRFISPVVTKSAVCSDPYSHAQWHHDVLSLHGAWRKTTGAASTIVILDDGVQYDHPDLVLNESLSFGWDVESGVRIPSANNPLAQHGTATAGVAAARMNNLGGCGVAPMANLAAVWLVSDGFVADASVELSLQELFVRNAVLSNSWGPADDGSVDGPGNRGVWSRVDVALRDFGTQARGGLGGIILFAAGNGGSNENANDDGFASHPATITVGAVGDHGERVWYSEPGTCIDVVAPSGGGTRNVLTTDLTGDAGAREGHVTDTFSGTSASTPMVAGVVGLMLSVRPRLSARDTRRILHITAEKTHGDDPSWVTNAAGHAFSPWYGFGLVNADAAVTKAKEWESLGKDFESCGGEWSGPLAGDSVRFEIPVALSFVEEARVFVDVVHPWRGDVLLSLFSPAGTESQITFPVDEKVGLRDAAFVPHTFSTRAFLGESGARDGWRLRVADLTGRGRLRRARLCVRGDPLFDPPAPPSTPPSPPYRLPPSLRVPMWSAAGSALACALTCCMVARYCRRRRCRTTPSLQTRWSVSAV